MADENYIEVYADDETHKEGTLIKGKDVIQLEAPEVRFSPDTPLDTEHQDAVGAINELNSKIGSGGSVSLSLSNNTIFEVPFYVYYNDYGTTKVMDTGTKLRIKLLRGPAASVRSATYDYAGSTYYCVEQTWNVYDNPYNTEQVTRTVSRVLRCEVRGSEKNMVQIYYGKWGLSYNEAFNTRTTECCDYYRDFSFIENEPAFIAGVLNFM